MTRLTRAVRLFMGVEIPPGHESFAIVTMQPDRPMKIDQVQAVASFRRRWWLRMLGHVPLLRRIVFAVEARGRRLAAPMLRLDWLSIGNRRFNADDIEVARESGRGPVATPGEDIAVKFTNLGTRPLEVRSAIIVTMPD